MICFCGILTIICAFLGNFRRKRSGCRCRMHIPHTATACISLLPATMQHSRDSSVQSSLLFGFDTYSFNLEYKQLVGANLG